jgi:hypothetical protein
MFTGSFQQSNLFIYLSTFTPRQKMSGRHSGDAGLGDTDIGTGIFNERHLLRHCGSVLPARGGLIRVILIRLL